MTVSTAQRAVDLGSEQLDSLMNRLHAHVGIKIDSTQAVIAGCIQERMEYLGITKTEDYLAAFDDSINARAEWLALVDLLTVKETRFFRQPEAYDCLGEYVERLMSEGPAPSELSFWSAGCSNGQELYSMAMVVDSVLSRYQPWLEWHGIGTDVSFKAISHAQAGVYQERAVRFIPDAFVDAYMVDKLGERVKVCDELRARTHFFHSNLLHADSAPFADFNIIFCQNVLIYFPREVQRWIIDQLVDRLRHGGLLILGAGEDVGWLNNSVRRRKWPGVCAYEKLEVEQ